MSTIANRAEMPPLDALRTLAEAVIAEARRAGVDAAEAAVSSRRGLSVSVRLDAVEQLIQSRDRGLTVTVYRGGRKGTASTADWDRQAVVDTVAAACAGARYTAVDDANGLADPGLLADPAQLPELDLDHPGAVADADAAIALARCCERAARGHDARIVNSEGAGVSSARTVSVYANTHGFCAGYATTRYGLSCTVIAAADDVMRVGNWYQLSRDGAALDQPEALGARAAERALARLGGRRLPTGRVPVLFSADMARTLFGHFVSAISGTALYRKASFLRDRLGSEVFPHWLTIAEQPHLPRALASAPFDAEGVRTAARDVVRDGVLAGYVLGSYGARRLGMSSTGNAGGVHNLCIPAGGDDAAGLCRSMRRGLWVTQLMGQGVNLVNGDYSRAANGFWIDDGVVQYPVEEVTIAGNLADMFRGLVAVGSDIDTRGAIRCGSALLDAMMLAGE